MKANSRSTSGRVISLRCLVGSAVLCGLLSFVGRSDAAFSVLRIPGAACVHDLGGSAVESSGGTMITTAVTDTPGTVVCPVTTDFPSSYNGLAFHYIDSTNRAAFSVNVCSSSPNGNSGGCFGTFTPDATSFQTPAGTVTGRNYPGFNLWGNNPADFPWVRVNIAPRGNCGTACFSSSLLVGLFLFHN